MKALGKILNGPARSIASGAVVIGAAGLVSRLLGVVRDRILAGEFGAGDVLDIYYASFRIPDLVFSLLVLGALSAGFIPVFTEYVEKKGRDKAIRLASSVLNVLMIAVIGVSAVLALIAPWIMELMAPGFAPEKLALAADMSRIMFLSPVLLAASSVFSGILQSDRKFVLYALAPIFYNLGIIAGALFLIEPLGINGLAWGVVLGSAMHMLLQLIGAKSSGFVWRPRLGWKSAGMRRIMRLMVPRTLTMVVVQLNLLLMTVIASLLAAGSLAVFNFANNLQSFVLGIFGISFAVSAFPALSAHVANDNLKKFRRSLAATARQILFFVIPASALLIVLRMQIVRVVLGTGQFSWEDTVLVASALGFFAFSLFAQSLVPLLIRGFYALHDSMSPFLVGLVALAANALLAVTFGRSHGVVGLAIAFSMASVLQAVILWIVLRAKAGGLHGGRVALSALRVLGATAGLVIAGQVGKIVVEPYVGTDTFVGVFLQGALAGLAGIAAFALLAWILRSPEMLFLLAAMRQRLTRRSMPAGEIGEDTAVS